MVKQEPFFLLLVEKEKELQGAEVAEALSNKHQRRSQKIVRKSNNWSIKRMWDLRGIALG
jgi:hypothetical protein